MLFTTHAITKPGCSAASAPAANEETNASNANLQVACRFVIDKQASDDDAADKAAFLSKVLRLKGAADTNRPAASDGDGDGVTPPFGGAVQVPIGKVFDAILRCCTLSTLAATRKDNDDKDDAAKASADGDSTAIMMIQPLSAQQAAAHGVAEEAALIRRIFFASNTAASKNDTNTETDDAAAEPTLDSIALAAAHDAAFSLHRFRDVVLQRLAAPQFGMKLVKVRADAAPQEPKYNGTDSAAAAATAGDDPDSAIAALRGLVHKVTTREGKAPAAASWLGW